MIPTRFLLGPENHIQAILHDSKWSILINAIWTWPLGMEFFPRFSLQDASETLEAPPAPGAPGENGAQSAKSKVCGNQCWSDSLFFWRTSHEYPWIWWIDINLSYFEVKYRATGFWPHLHLGFKQQGCGISLGKAQNQCFVSGLRRPRYKLDSSSDTCQPGVACFENLCIGHQELTSHLLCWSCDPIVVESRLCTIVIGDFPVIRPQISYDYHPQMTAHDPIFSNGLQIFIYLHSVSFCILYLCMDDIRELPSGNFLHIENGPFIYIHFSH